MTIIPDCHLPKQNWADFCNISHLCQWKIVFEVMAHPEYDYAFINLESTPNLLFPEKLCPCLHSQQQPSTAGHDVPICSPCLQSLPGKKQPNSICTTKATFAHTLQESNKVQERDHPEGDEAKHPSIIRMSTKRSPSIVPADLWNYIPDMV